MRHQVGIVGLGVMGGSLARNMDRHGVSVVGYDQDPATTRRFLEGTAARTGIVGVRTASELMASLERPRRLLMMVPAGAAVDSAIEHLAAHLQTGDILIDAGNSWFLDTERRCTGLAERGLAYAGIGVSGGEEGALWGPSIMPGGEREAYNALAPVFRAIAAKAEEDGEPCVEYMGPRGAGHYVKMVHNGIEYADMQLIAETYDLLHRGLALSSQELHEIFAEWNTGALRSYLIGITAEILTRLEPETQQPLVDVILDEASQKGTGKWTVLNALDLGAPVPTIQAAVEARMLSALKPERVVASRVIRGPVGRRPGPRQPLIDAARDALYASKVTSYAQGFALLRRGSTQYGYGLDAAAIAKIWRAGCIIRADLLSGIRAAYDRQPALTNLLLDERFRDAVERRQESWRFVIQTAVSLGVPVPALSASLAYFDAYRSERLPANLTQAQRDYFGAHTYQRLDKPGVFHTEWGRPRPVDQRLH
jgi:6-phosphogluconate dehydrogenase